MNKETWWENSSSSHTTQTILWNRASYSIWCILASSNIYSLLNLVHLVCFNCQEELTAWYWKIYTDNSVPVYMDKFEPVYSYWRIALCAVTPMCMLVFYIKNIFKFTLDSLCKHDPCRELEMGTECVVRKLMLKSLHPINFVVTASKQLPPEPLCIHKPW